MDILFLVPVFKQMVWGGDRLRTEFGYDIPGDDTGECWAISAHQNGDCLIKNGEFEGMHLSELWNKRRDLFGNEEGDVFPLLTKIIDARADLSIQVHPDDAYAKEHENGSLGKTECWYVLDCEDSAELIIGHNANTKEELYSMIDEGRWDELLRYIPIKKGDFIQINPGTIHAIKAGTMILETQQNSDITYRLYDYDRLSNGKKRELHIDKSKDVIKVPYKEDGDRIARVSKDNIWMEELIHCDYYTVWRGQLKGKEVLKQKYSFMLVSVINGRGKLGDYEIKKGDHFILPYQFGVKEIEGELEVICSTIG